LRVEAEPRAALEAVAKAEKAKVIVEAERARIDAEAQAKANFARLEAEARGQYEILAKKGEGLQRIIAACGGPEQAFRLLMLEHVDERARTAATAVSNINFDKVIVWENGSSNGTGPGATANFVQSMAGMLQPMMQVMRDIGGLDLPAAPRERAAEPTENGAAVKGS
jgi:flotillin